MDRATFRRIKALVVEMATLLEWANDRYETPRQFDTRVNAALAEARALRDLVQGSLDAGNAFYFGALGTAEHRLYDANLRPVPGFPGVNVTDIPDVIVAGLDGGLCPDGEAEGRARVQVIEEWTCVAFWDRSVDRRLRSHSTFVLKGVFGGALALTQAQLLFPAIFARYPFPVEVTT